MTDDLDAYHARQRANDAENRERNRRLLSEPDRAIVHDHDRDVLVELPRLLIVWHQGRLRSLMLRMARGVIVDADPIDLRALGVPEALAPDPNEP